MKAARPRSEGEVSCGNTGIDSNLGEGRAVTLEPYPTIPPRLNPDDHFRVLQRFVKEFTFVIVFDIPPKPTLPKE